MLARWIFAGLIVLGITGSLTGIKHANAAESEKAKKYNFVQTANEAIFKGGVLELDGVGPATAYFSDRPNREVGQIKHEKFFKSWLHGTDSLYADPPNASLTYVDHGTLTIAVVELTNPVLSKDEIRYNAKLLAGKLPRRLGRVSLFIDPGGLMCLVCNCCNE